MINKKLPKAYLMLLLAVVFSLTTMSPVYSYSNDNKNYTYDANGRLTYIDSRSERLSLQYDLQGNLIYKINETNLNGRYGMKSTGSISYGEQDYSSVQGQGNWYYQQWDGSRYEPYLQKRSVGRENTIYNHL